MSDAIIRCTCFNGAIRPLDPIVFEMGKRYTVEIAIVGEVDSDWNLHTPEGKTYPFDWKAGTVMTKNEINALVSRIDARIITPELPIKLTLDLTEAEIDLLLEIVNDYEDHGLVQGEGWRSPKANALVDSINAQIKKQRENR